MPQVLLLLLPLKWYGLNIRLLATGVLHVLISQVLLLPLLLLLLLLLLLSQEWYGLNIRLLATRVLHVLIPQVLLLPQEWYGLNMRLLASRILHILRPQLLLSPFPASFFIPSISYIQSFNFFTYCYTCVYIYYIYFKFTTRRECNALSILTMKLQKFLGFLFASFII